MGWYPYLSMQLCLRTQLFRNALCVEKKWTKNLYFDSPMKFGMYVFGLSVCPSQEISRHFVQNALEEWTEIWHADVSGTSSVLIRFWSQSVDFHYFGLWLSETDQIWGFQTFSWETHGEWPEIRHADLTWPPSETIRFWSWSFDFPYFGTALA